MNRRRIAVVMLSLLMLNAVMFALEVSPVGASGTIYIQADGSISPEGAPISTSDSIIYLLTSNTDSAIVIQRNNILFHGNGFTVQGAGNGTGIDISAASNVTIEDTYIVGFQYGVNLYSSQFNSILKNCLIQNQIGVFLGGSSNNTIGGNEVINSTYAGILMNGSSYNVISKNDIATNYDGILTDYSFDNTIVHNNFVGSTSRQVDIVSSGSGNVYDEGYPWCGNYWSDYVGTDIKSGPYQNETGSDGVGDMAHVLGDFHVDNYPLMNPWTSSFTVLNHMVVDRAGGPMTLDPAEGYDTASGEVIMNVYEPLIFFDEEKTDQFVPRLATNWEISPDGLTYTFGIRQGVRFHNNETLTPEDVEYSLERIFVIGDMRAQAPWMFYEAFFNVSGSRDEHVNFTVTGQQIDDAVTRNGTSVTLHLTRPYSPLMQILAEPWTSILCKKWCVQIGDWPGTWNNWTLYNNYYGNLTTAIEAQSTDPPGPRTNAMCGTGPFMFDYYEARVEWQLVRFDGYWGGWPANGSGGSLKRVTGKIIVDWKTREDMFLDGQLDSLPVPVTEVGEVLGQPGVQSIYPLQQLTCYALFFNFNISTLSPFMGVSGGLPRGTLNESGIPPDFFTDVNVRKGFAYAFNYSQLIAEALNGEAFQPATPIIPGLPFYNPAQEKYDINLTKAAQCFSTAWGGQLWSSGFNFTICCNLGNTIRQKACLIMKANVESLNSKFHIQIQPLSWVDYWNSAASNHTLPIFDLGWLADFADPHDFAEGFMYSGMSGAFAVMQSYSNSTIDALVQQGINTMNETARRQTYYALQSAYHDDCPSVPTYQPLGRRFQRNWVQGWYFNPLFNGDYFYTEWKGGTPNSTRYSWSMFHRDPTHTGHTESPAPNTNQLRWNYTAGGWVESSPAVADGKVYVGSGDNKTYCLDAVTGALVWNYTTGGWVFSSPAIVAGKVYVGSLDGKVYCLDAVTGAQVWNYATGGWVESSIAVADGVAYVGSEGGHVYAFGNVIKVPEDYRTIQAAINAATPGATIWIAPGVYHESLLINKTITLIGKPGSEPIFNGGGSGIAITIVSSGSGSTIAGITITSWDQGIILQDAASCKIYDNIMSLINNNGVVLQGTGAVSNQVCGNMFEQDSVAVDVTSSSSSNVISQNIISLSSIGLRIETSGNTVCENMISQNQLGINIVNSNNNAIYHNNFMDNTIAFQLSSSTSPGNSWDNGYPSGGNYWSTWTGPDKNSGPNQNILGVSDGIIDTPYTIAVNNKDNYPLAKPFQLHNVGIATVTLGKTVVGRGYCCNITLIIVDYGLYGETFNMAIWVSQLRIDLQPVVLADRSSTEINFTWDTTGFLYGNYTVHSVADVVPDETLTADNNYVFNVPVHVGVPGDVSGTTPGVYDGITNMKDIAYLVSLFNTRPSSPNWQPNADVNNDGLCNMKDIAIAVYYFNQRE